jgi:hypothetical protein
MQTRCAAVVPAARAYQLCLAQIGVTAVLSGNHLQDAIDDDDESAASSGAWVTSEHVTGGGVNLHPKPFLRGACSGSAAVQIQK